MSRVFRADDAGPDDHLMGSSELVEGVLAKLEEAGVDQATCDSIVKIIEKWEYSKISVCEHAVVEGDWCPDCNEAYKQATSDNQPAERGGDTQGREQ